MISSVSLRVSSRDTRMTMALERVNLVKNDKETLHQSSFQKERLEKVSEYNKSKMAV